MFPRNVAVITSNSSLSAFVYVCTVYLTAPHQYPRLYRLGWQDDSCIGKDVKGSDSGLFQGTVSTSASRCSAFRLILSFFFFFASLTFPS
jgi:hypothetical protein